MTDLIYVVAYKEEYRLMASFLINSLRTNGEFTGDIMLFVDYIDYRIESIKEKCSIVKLNNTDSEKLLKIEVAKEINFDNYKNIIYLDSDILCLKPIEYILNQINDDSILCCDDINKYSAFRTLYLDEIEKPKHKDDNVVHTGQLFGRSANFKNLMTKLSDFLSSKKLKIEQSAFNALDIKKEIKLKKLDDKSLFFSKRNVFSNKVLNHYCGSDSKSFMRMDYINNFKRTIKGNIPENFMINNSIYSYGRISENNGSEYHQEIELIAVEDNKMVSDNILIYEYNNGYIFVKNKTYSSTECFFDHIENDVAIGYSIINFDRFFIKFKNTKSSDVINVLINNHDNIKMLIDTIPNKYKIFTKNGVENTNILKDEKIDIEINDSLTIYDDQFIKCSDNNEFLMRYEIKTNSNISFLPSFLNGKTGECSLIKVLFNKNSALINGLLYKAVFKNNFILYGEFVLYKHENDVMSIFNTNTKQKFNISIK